MYNNYHIDNTESVNATFSSFELILLWTPELRTEDSSHRKRTI